MAVRCDISVSCTLNVCKANQSCIVSKCSLETKKELKEFVETNGYIVEQISLLQENITATNKDYIFRSSKDECFWCKQKIIFESQRTKDHVTPKLRGGKNENNLVWCCKKCNSDKGLLTLQDWFSKVSNYHQNSTRKTKILETITAVLKLNKVVFRLK